MILFCIGDLRGVALSTVQAAYGHANTVSWGWFMLSSSMTIRTVNRVQDRIAGGNRVDH